jgi:hypothetical protein
MVKDGFAVFIWAELQQFTETVGVEKESAKMRSPSPPSFCEQRYSVFHNLHSEAAVD